MMNDERINDILNGRLVAVLSGIVLLVTAIMAAKSGELPVPDAGSGLFFNIKGSFIENTHLSVLANVLGIIGIGLMLLLLDKKYSVVRAYTFITITSFFVLEMACPLLTCGFNTGTALGLVLAAGAYLLFSTYQNKRSQRVIFLVMAVLSCSVMFHWAFIALIPPFLLGFAYMRSLGFKGFLAALIGLITPFWIALGTGLVSPSDFKPIEIHAVWNTLETAQAGVLIAWVVLLIIITIAVTVMNLFSIYTYRLQLRVYNAFFVMVIICTLVAMCIDYRDFSIFIPMLNYCLAIQIAHAFTISTFVKRHVFIFILMALALAFFVASLTL